MDWFTQHLPDPAEVPTVILTQPTGEYNGRVKEADEYTEGFKLGVLMIRLSLTLLYSAPASVTLLTGRCVHPAHTGSVVSFAFLPGGFGCQHMKFLLLFYKTGRLRVVITSANMRSADWYIMDNVRDPDVDEEH
jgi:hypothetical protein